MNATPGRNKNIIGKDFNYESTNQRTYLELDPFNDMVWFALDWARNSGGRIMKKINKNCSFVVFFPISFLDLNASVVWQI